MARGYPIRCSRSPRFRDMAAGIHARIAEPFATERAIIASLAHMRLGPSIKPSVLASCGSHF